MSINYEYEKELDELNIIKLQRLIEGDSRLYESEDGSSLHQGMNIFEVLNKDEYKDKKEEYFGRLMFENWMLQYGFIEEKDIDKGYDTYIQKYDELYLTELIETPDRFKEDFEENKVPSIGVFLGVKHGELSTDSSQSDKYYHVTQGMEYEIPYKEGVLQREGSKTREDFSYEEMKDFYEEIKEMEKRELIISENLSRQGSNVLEFKIPN